MNRWMLLVALACAASGCLVRKDTLADKAHYSGHAPGKAPTNADAIEVLESLPEGIAYRDRNVKVEPDFPTPEDPHVVLGVFSVTRHPDDPKTYTESELLTLAKRTAAEQGGNALYRHPRLDGYYVLHVSSAAPRYAAPADLWKELEGGYIGSAFHKVAEAERKLEAFEPLPISTQGMRCYKVAFVLAEDATFEPEVKWGIVIDVQRGKDKRSYTENPPRGRQNLVRNRVFPVACVKAGGSISISLRPQKAGPFGQGKMQIRVYEMSLGQAERKHKCAALNGGERSLAQSEDLCL
ncbi:hypothetical protein [Polyangium spumosum]|uniref:Lipoprotein n=1 Tax=Polyangium spumosum TaxID=889282 RepID=A0A6N7PYB4_9BACT|nr:hypothetical protein [Polyangium spumosum]MRG96889.1 hypothetical protein [Polyangium spumosum]